MITKELFKLVTELWPKELDTKNSKLMGDTGFISDELNKQYADIMTEVGIENPWIEIGCWSFNQALWEVAKGNFDEGIFIAKPAEVTIERFDELLRQNLADESWYEERVEYNKINPL